MPDQLSKSGLISERARERRGLSLRPDGDGDGDADDYESPQRLKQIALSLNVDNSCDVICGAVGSKKHDGLIYVDRHIPEFSPKLKERSGKPARLWTYLAVHEYCERHRMGDGASYLPAHNYATARERRVVEADGVNWRAYTEEMDGFLDRVEHEHAKRVPPDPHVSCRQAVLAGKPHHHSANKRGA